jgi:hypothetical protein
LGFGTPGPLAAAHKRGGSLIPMMQTPSAYGSSAIPANKLGVIKEIEVNKPHIHLSKEMKQKIMDLNQAD